MTSRYQTAVPLGQGGTAEVLKAWDPALGCYVALKFLRRDDPILVERMLREARAQARIEHENVCRIHDIGELDGRTFIAMQYVDGLELGDAAVEMNLEDKVQLVFQVANAIHEAHRQGVVHRDLKPANIMVERQADGRWKPIVVDFGLVWEHQSEGLTRVGQVLGTPPFLAPEQVEGNREQIDRRTDVYGLGATLYTILAGRPPFEDSEGVELLIQVVERQPTPLRRIDPTMPVALETIVHTCLEKDKSRRYESAKHLADDLRRFLDGAQVAARPPGWWVRIRRKARRHRAVVAVAVIASLLLFAAAASLAVHRWRSEKRLELEQRFGRYGNDAEWTMRGVHLSAAQDIRPIKQRVREHIARMEAELEAAGPLAEGPGHHALGRAHLALLEDEEARYHLQTAWDAGYRTPEVAYALGLVRGRLYERQLSRAISVGGVRQREARVEQLEASHRQPILELLRTGRTAQSAAPEYVEGLLAFYERRYDDAIAKARAARTKLPWLYEADLLIGRAHDRRGLDQFATGERDAARRSMDDARVAFRRALRSAGSAPRAHLGLCGAETALLRFAENASTSHLVAHRDRALEACHQALEIDPELADIYVQLSALWRFVSAEQTRALEDSTAATTKAAQLAEKALELEPDSVEALLSLAEAHGAAAERVMFNRSGDPWPHLAGAEAALTRVLELHPNHPGALNQLGSSYARRGTFELIQGIESRPSLAKAIQSLRQAIEITPDLYSPHYTLGIAHQIVAFVERSKGLDFESSARYSIASFERAIAIDPAAKWAHLEWASSLISLAIARSLSGAEYDVVQTLVDQALDRTARAIELDATVPEFRTRQAAIRADAARLALHADRDTAGLLDAARRSLDAMARVAGSNDVSLTYDVYVLIVESVALRAALIGGKPAEMIIRRAEASLAPLLEAGPNPVTLDVIAEYLTWRAQHELLQGEDVMATVSRAMALIAPAIDEREDAAPLIALRGTLHLLVAYAEVKRGGALDEARLGRAIDDLQLSVSRIRWLARDVEPYLVKARELASPMMNVRWVFD